MQWQSLCHRIEPLFGQHNKSPGSIHGSASFMSPIHLMPPGYRRYKSDFSNCLKRGKTIMKKILGFGFSVVLLCGMWAGGATAQVNNSSQLSATRFVGWDANTPDVTVTSLIQQTVSSHSSGIPAGLHLMGTPQGVLAAL
jgi:hypothetical protein